MPFIMNPEGVARLFARDMVVDGPLPEHYEPSSRRWIPTPCIRKNAKAKSNPVSRLQG